MVILKGLSVSYEARCSNYEAEFRKKCAELNLEPCFLDAMIPASTLPYHNKRHMVNVAFDSDFIASSEGVSVEDRRNLFVAGLYHDANHTGVSKPDTANIKKVKEFFTANSDAFWEAENINLMRDVMPIVEATNTDRYSVTPSYLGGILRDADVLGWAYIDFDFLSHALSSETGVEVSLSSTKEFLSSHKFFSNVSVEALRQSGLL